MSQRILFVVNHAGFFLSHRLPVALAARAAGYDVHVATPSSRHAPRVLAAGLVWHDLRLSRSRRNPVGEVTTIADLYRLYRSLRPALTHHVTSKPVLYGTPVARAAGVHAVVNAISGMGHVFARENGAPSLLRSGVEAGYRVALRHPRMRVIFQNPEHRAEFVRRGWVRHTEAVLIPGSGVDTAAYLPATVHRQEVPLIVLASRMLWTKGVGEFVEAATELAREGVAARFALVGEPDPDNLASIPEDQLRAWAAAGAVEYWGRRDDMPKVLRHSDIACLPSYSEGLPKSLVEAAACGLPIVTTDVDGCRAVVCHGENGLLVPVRDSTALASALRRLIDDPVLRRCLGAAGRIRAEAEFSLARVIAAHLAVYGELLS
jgi:glycosyltransferase involved in cell wall biosynthesis